MFRAIELLYFLSVIFHTSSGTPAITPGSCDEQKLRECAENAEPLLRNSDLVVPDTPKAVNQVCSIWTELTSCVNDYTKRCMTPFQRLEFDRKMKDPLSAMASLCKNTENQNEYLAYAPCVKKISTQEKFCGKQYKFLIDHVSESTSLKRVCCAREKFMSCLQTKTAGGCSNRVGNNSTRLAVAILDNSLAFMSQQCATSRFQDSDCPGIDGNRANSKGPLSGNPELESSVSGGNLGSQFQLDQRPTSGGSGKKPTTSTKPISEKNPQTAGLSSTTREKKPQTKPGNSKESGVTSLRQNCNLLVIIITFSVSVMKQNM